MYPKEDVPGLGYLVWNHIPHECFLLPHANADIADYFAKNDPINMNDHVHGAIRTCREVDTCIENLTARRIRRVRIGISWMEWSTPGGQAVINWYVRRYAKAGFHVLPCLAYTPIWLGMSGATNSPPYDSQDFAHLVSQVCLSLGNCFEEVELWNEWNLNTDWNAGLDPNYDQFALMIAVGSIAARAYGKIPVLGGVSKVNGRTLFLIRELAAKGVMQYVDAVGFHNLRGTWSDAVPPPPLDVQADMVREAVSQDPDPEKERALRSRVRIGVERIPHIAVAAQVVSAKKKSIWLTEYGFPPVDPSGYHSREYLERIQAGLFAHAVSLLRTGKLDRVYWYTLFDKETPSVRYAMTGWEDVLQHYYGDTDVYGDHRLLAKLLCEGGPLRVYEYMKRRNIPRCLREASLKRSVPQQYWNTRQKP